MKHLIRTATVAAALIATTGLGYASTLDQSNPAMNGISSDLNPNLELQQQVTAGISGVLAGITLYDDSQSPDNETLSIGIGNAFTSTFVYSEAVTLAPSKGVSFVGTLIDLSAADIQLTEGETFVIDLSDGSGGADTGNLGAYAGGDLYFKAGSNPPRDYTTLRGGSLAFQTYMDPTPTPEPSSILLLLTGFSAGAGLLRRRMKV